MFLFVQYLLKSSLSMFSLAIHLFILGNYVAIISKLFFLSYLMICFSKNLIGPLSKVLVMECH